MKYVEAMLQREHGRALPTTAHIERDLTKLVDYINDGVPSLSEIANRVKLIASQVGQIEDALDDHECENELMVPVGDVTPLADQLYRRNGFLPADIVAIVKLADIQWRLAAKELPPVGIPVLAYYKNSHGHGRRIRATFSGLHTLLISDDAEDYGCNCGKCDGEYVKPGRWYEDNEHEDVNWYVDETITHWMPLPEAPR